MVAPAPKSRKILLLGGAGYVGGSVAAWLLARGHEIHVVDDLSTGHPETLRALELESRFTPARAGDRDHVGALLDKERFDGVMHFAASALVAESVSDPGKYRENNFEQTRALAEMLVARGGGRLVFSSTCAVFGDPGDRAISESQPKTPINPYGATKLEAERMLERLSTGSKLRVVVLRYFNAAGAEGSLRVGEWHDPETHLIPNILRAAARGEPVPVYGTDYKTADGTCIRDYVHVEDLAAAHEAALERMIAAAGDEGSFEAFNLGSERGYSVREVVAGAGRALGRIIPVSEQARRPGDPPRLVADSTLARRELGFVARHGIDEIIRSAAAWERLRTAPRPAIFLDRDGTINPDPGYLRSPEQMTLLPGVGQALADLKRAGYLLVVVSNQSGVGRGVIRAEDIPAIHARLARHLLPFGVNIDHYELCFHVPEARCSCRKPEPKLVLDAARHLGIDLSRSWMIGDKPTDIECGRRSGCRGSILVRTGEGTAAEKLLAPGLATTVSDDLASAARFILTQTPPASGPGR